jgi:gliding motility-associated-like protein
LKKKKAILFRSIFVKANNLQSTTKHTLNPDIIPTLSAPPLVIVLEHIRLLFIQTLLRKLLANSTNVLPGDTIQLNTNAEATYSYLWTSNAYLSNTTIVNPVASIESSTWITVQVTDTNNCRTYDSIYITIQDCESSIYIPNAFTPNGDGNNDGYRIFGNCIQLNQLLIFNRWGEKVWETKDMEKEWNGYYKGVLQPSGVYVYWLSYNTMTIQNNIGKVVKGSITLIR